MEVWMMILVISSGTAGAPVVAGTFRTEQACFEAAKLAETKSHLLLQLAIRRNHSAILAGCVKTESLPAR